MYAKIGNWRRAAARDVRRREKAREWRRERWPTDWQEPVEPVSPPYFSYPVAVDRIIKR